MYSQRRQHILHSEWMDSRCLYSCRLHRTLVSFCLVLSLLLLSLQRLLFIKINFYSFYLYRFLVETSCTVTTWTCNFVSTILNKSHTFRTSIGFLSLSHSCGMQHIIMFNAFSPLFVRFTSSLSLSLSIFVFTILVNCRRMYSISDIMGT